MRTNSPSSYRLRRSLIASAFVSIMLITGLLAATTPQPAAAQWYTYTPTFSPYLLVNTATPGLWLFSSSPTPNWYYRPSATPDFSWLFGTPTPSFRVFATSDFSFNRPTPTPELISGGIDADDPDDPPNRRPGDNDDAPIIRFYYDEETGQFADMALRRLVLPSEFSYDPYNGGILDPMNRFRYDPLEYMRFDPFTGRQFDAPFRPPVLRWR